jgi:hypothetical protein
MRYLLALTMVAMMAEPSGAAQRCMPCQSKCSICFNAGKSTFPSIAACEANCNANGNPSVLATCGVRAVCPTNRR